MAVYSVVKKEKELRVRLPIQLLVDTREQKPLWIYPTCLRLCLKVGDYTTVKLNNIFIIERKSPGDLYGTITKGNRRFKREILRAQENNIELVVFTETTRSKFVNKKFPGGRYRKFSTSGLEKIIDTLTSKYKLQFIWCQNRADMKSKIVARLTKEELRYKV